MPSVQSNAVREMACAPEEVTIDFKSDDPFVVKTTPDCKDNPVNPDDIMNSIMPTSEDMS